MQGLTAVLANIAKDIFRSTIGEGDGAVPEDGMLAPQADQIPVETEYGIGVLQLAFGMIALIAFIQGDPGLLTGEPAVRSAGPGHGDPGMIPLPARTF